MAPELDISDCFYTVHMGDGVKRSLIRHFAAALRGKIFEMGGNPDDPQLINPDAIEREAWRLADSAMDQALPIIEDTFEFAYQNDPAEMLREPLNEAIAEVWKDFCEDGLSLDVFLQIATDAPLIIR